MEPFGIFILVISGVMVANILMFATNRAVTWYRRTGGMAPLYIAGLLIAICAFLSLSPLLMIPPPH